MIKAVFFDVGGTLIEPFPSVGAVYSRLAAAHGVSLTESELNQRFRHSWSSLKEERQKIDRDWWKRVVQSVFSDQTFADFDAFFTVLYREFESPSVWKIFPDVRPALESLKEKGLRLFVASNWDSRLPKLLIDLKLAAFFERQFASFKVGYVKPDPRFFRYCLEQIQLPASQVIHIGDDEIEDLNAAAEAGIQSLLIKRRSKNAVPQSLLSLSKIESYLK